MNNDHVSMVGWGFNSRPFSAATEAHVVVATARAAGPASAACALANCLRDSEAAILAPCVRTFKPLDSLTSEFPWDPS